MAASATVAITSCLDLLEHGPEEALLVGEVVVQRAPGDAGPLDDRLPAGGGVPVAGEELPGGPDQGAAGGGRPLGLAPALAFGFGERWLDSHGAPAERCVQPAC